MTENLGLSEDTREAEYTDCPNSRGLLVISGKRSLYHRYFTRALAASFSLGRFRAQCNYSKHDSQRVLMFKAIFKALDGLQTQRAVGMLPGCTTKYRTSPGKRTHPAEDAVKYLNSFLDLLCPSRTQQLYFSRVLITSLFLHALTAAPSARSGTTRNFREDSNICMLLHV